MSRARSIKQRLLSILAGLALLLQVAVPVGFMPSSMAGGWYIELCPDGLPTQVLVALYGEHHAHHGDGGDSSFYQCDYGAGSTAGALLLDCSASPWDYFSAADPVAATPPFVATDPQLAGYRSRAPPSVVRYSSNKNLTNA